MPLMLPLLHSLGLSQSQSLAWVLCLSLCVVLSYRKEKHWAMASVLCSTLMSWQNKPWTPALLYTTVDIWLHHIWSPVSCFFLFFRFFFFNQPEHITTWHWWQHFSFLVETKFHLINRHHSWLMVKGNEWKRRQRSNFHWTDSPSGDRPKLRTYGVTPKKKKKGGYEFTAFSFSIKIIWRVMATANDYWVCHIHQLQKFI